MTRDNRDGDKWTEVTGELGLNYHVNEEMMLYASYSRGYKAGGYNTDQDDAYDPETVDAFELGLKSQWLDNRVQANVAAFYYLYSDKQDYKRFIQAGTGLSIFQIINASEAEIGGVELEMQAHVSDAFFVDGTIAYLNAEFEEFSSIDTVFAGLGEQDLSGNKLPLSPEWKMNIGAEYHWMLGGDLGTLLLRGDYAWVDQQFGNAFNRDGTGLQGDGDLIDSHYRVNARLQWQSIDESWAAEFYVRNLSDEVAISNVFVPHAGQSAVTHLEPRTYGLKVSYEF